MRRRGVEDEETGCWRRKGPTHDAVQPMTQFSPTISSPGHYSKVRISQREKVAVQIGAVESRGASKNLSLPPFFTPTTLSFKLWFSPALFLPSLFLSFIMERIITSFQIVPDILITRSVELQSETPSAFGGKLDWLLDGTTYRSSDYGRRLNLSQFKAGFYRLWSSRGSYPVLRGKDVGNPSWKRESRSNGTSGSITGRKSPTQKGCLSLYLHAPRSSELSFSVFSWISYQKQDLDFIFQEHWL